MKNEFVSIVPFEIEVSRVGPGKISVFICPVFLVLAEFFGFMHFVTLKKTCYRKGLVTVFEDPDGHVEWLVGGDKVQK